MLIAFYELGNLKHSLGVLHTEKGKPIFKRGEVLIKAQAGVRCRIIKLKGKLKGSGKWCGWLRWGSVEIFPDLGNGIFYRTEERLIYLREPNYKIHMAHAALSKLEQAAARALAAKDWAHKKLLEGFALSVKEVRRCKRFVEPFTRRHCVQLYVEDRTHDVRYIVTLSSYTPIFI
jgi:hypothetical protein